MPLFHTSVAIVPEFVRNPYSDPITNQALIMTKFLRAANFIMVALFFLFALVQYNDPDPVQWMVLYGAAAIACIFSLRNKLHPLFPAITGAVALTWACFIAPGVFRENMLPKMLDSVQMMSPAIEEAREMCGLLIVAAWMTVLIVASRTPSAQQT